MPWYPDVCKIMCTLSPFWANCGLPTVSQMGRLGRLICRFWFMEKFLRKMHTSKACLRHQNDLLLFDFTDSPVATPEWWSKLGSVTSKVEGKTTGCRAQTDSIKQQTQHSPYPLISQKYVEEELGGGGRKMEFTNLQARRQLVWEFCCKLKLAACPASPLILPFKWALPAVGGTDIAWN